jgi:serine protease Do
MAKKIGFELIEKGKVTRPWMGITLRTLTNETADALGIGIDSGVLILDVIKDSPADKAGLEGTYVKRDWSEVIPGDVITEIEGLEIKSADDLIEVLNEFKPGQEIRIAYYRGGEIRETTLVVGEKP